MKKNNFVSPLEDFAFKIELQVKEKRTMTQGCYSTGFLL